MTKSILHTVNQSPFNSDTLAQCIASYRPGDSILLLEDGVYAALLSHAFVDQLAGTICYGIEADINARGLHRQALMPSLQLTDYKGFVALSVQHPLIQSWY
ncbi:MAG: sulfurtransferase complex subunit TusB [Pseudomonadota bacterium]